MDQQDSTLRMPENLEDWLPVLELATREVFAKMAHSELSSVGNHRGVVSSVTAMVGLAGKLGGVVSIRCEQEAAALMASRMLGVNLAEAKPSIADAIGEICNMVAGNFKHKIPGLSEGCFLAPPSVVSGGDYSVYARPQTPRIHLSLFLENMPVMVSLYVVVQAAAKKIPEQNPTQPRASLAKGQSA
jgi:chemotaxis protein CheX